MTHKRDTKRHNNTEAPEPSLRRMPAYWHFLKDIKDKGYINISAPAMSEELKLDPTQIVKDIAITGIKGKPKVGYNVDELINSIENYLGFNKNNEAFLVGTGKLGQALLSYHSLQGFGINIIAAFDVDSGIVDKRIGNVKVLSFDKLGELAARLGVCIGILTTPGETAQDAAEAMVKSGIKAIWNFTPVKLRLPENVIIQDTSMYSNLAVLLRKLHVCESNC